MKKYVFSADGKDFTDDIDYVLNIAKSRNITTIRVAQEVKKTHRDLVDITEIDSFIEQIQNSVYDEHNECSNGYLDDFDSNKKEKLTELVVSFLNKNVVQPNFFQVSNIENVSINEIEKYISTELKVIYAKHYFNRILIILEKRNKIFFGYISSGLTHGNQTKGVFFPCYLIKSDIGPNLGDELNNMPYGWIPKLVNESGDFVPYYTKAISAFHPNIKILNENFPSLMENIKIIGTNDVNYNYFDERKQYMDDTKKEMNSIVEQYDGFLTVEELY